VIEIDDAVKESIKKVLRGLPMNIVREMYLAEIKGELCFIFEEWNDSVEETLDRVKDEMKK